MCYFLTAREKNNPQYCFHYSVRWCCIYVDLWDTVIKGNGCWPSGRVAVQTTDISALLSSVIGRGAAS